MTFKKKKKKKEEKKTEWYFQWLMSWKNNIFNEGKKKKIKATQQLKKQALIKTKYLMFTAIQWLEKHVLMTTFNNV